MKTYRLLPSLSALVLLINLSSCEKIFMVEDISDDAQTVFEHLWQDARERYSYFEFKEIDWHEVKNRYEERIYDGMPEKELFNVLAEMLFELEDGHVNLTSSFDRSRNWDWFQNYPLDYNQGIIDRNYLGRDFRITGPFRNQVIDSVLYVNYRSFTEQISDAHMDQLMERAQGLKGVIIDVRSNGGGNLDNANKLASGFTLESYNYGRNRIKNGPCPDCFSSWNTLNVTPRDGLKYAGKVVVLTNRASYSSTTFFAEMMRQNENAKLVGSPTGGGGGTPVFGELPNGWLYRFSSTQTISMQGEHLEPGVPVDDQVSLLQEDEHDGVDTIIEFALERIVN